MEKTVMMKKGGQVRQVPVAKVSKFIDRGFVKVSKKDDKLVEIGGKIDLAEQLKKANAEIKSLKAKLAKK